MQREKELVMEKKVVKIPHIAEELRIGYSFNYLIKVIAETDADEAVQWDFSDANFLHPFFLAPLAIYKNTSGKFYWHGTIILLRIPVKMPEGFNYIDYLE